MVLAVTLTEGNLEFAELRQKWEVATVRRRITVQGWIPRGGDGGDHPPFDFDNTQAQEYF